MTSARAALAQRLRFLADRLDPRGAPRMTGFSYTFVRGEGIVFHDDLRGCPLWYLGEDDHARAWDPDPPSRGSHSFHESRDDESLPPCAAVHVHGANCGHGPVPGVRTDTGIPVPDHLARFLPRRPR